MCVCVTVHFLFFACAAHLWFCCTSCTDVEHRAGWCNAKQTCVVCQMWFSSAKSGLTGTPAKHTDTKGLWATKSTHENNTWKIHFPLYGLLCKTISLVYVFVCMCLCVCEIVKRHSRWWQQEQQVKPLWFNNLSSSIRSIPVLPGFFLPLRLSLCASIASSPLPLYFMAAVTMDLDLEEIKNLCCFPVGGLMSIKSHIMAQRDILYSR